MGVIIEKSKKYSRQNSRSVWYEVQGVDSKRYTSLYDAVETGLLAIEVWAPPHKIRSPLPSPITSHTTESKEKPMSIPKDQQWFRDRITSRAIEEEIIESMPACKTRETFQVLLEESYRYADDAVITKNHEILLDRLSGWLCKNQPQAF